MKIKHADVGFMNRTSIWLNGIMGFAVGDALGAPAEFGERWMRDMDPVKEMRSGGIFDVPEGGWTDDTSMTIAILESLKNDFNPEDMMKRFISWYRTGEYSWCGKPIGVGKQILRALEQYEENGDINVSEPELCYFTRLNDFKSFCQIDRDSIKSSGYVVDTLEAVIWCLVTTDTFKDCLLNAVNLGLDTDTIAALAGGLAGLYYGYDEIPKEWLEVLKLRGELEQLCE